MRGEPGPAGLTGPPGPEGKQGLPGRPGPAAKGGATKSFVIDLVEHSTQLRSEYVASLKKPLEIKEIGGNIVGWEMIKESGFECQIVNEKDIMFQRSGFCSAYIYVRSRTDVSFNLVLYNREEAKEEKIVSVSIPKHELTPVLLEFKVNPPAEYHFMIKGKDLDIELDKKSRFEFVFDNTWLLPDDIDGDIPQPWKEGVVVLLSKNIEKYRFLHITAKKGLAYVNKIISPSSMEEGEAWNVSLENKCNLEFSGKEHKKLTIKKGDGFGVTSMIGIVC